LLGILPIFHSFGYTATDVGRVLTLPPKGIYHFSPLEARRGGQTVPPTRGHHHDRHAHVSGARDLRRCEPEDFAKLDVAFTGAEKLTAERGRRFRKNVLASRPVEGYGTTNFLRWSSANMPPSRANRQEGAGVKIGTVGPRCPGISVKVVDLDTAARTWGQTRSGMLLVTGPKRDEGLLRPARSDGRCDARRLVCHGRRGRDRRRALYQNHPGAISRSRSWPAKWCRTFRVEEAISRSPATR